MTEADLKTRLRRARKLLKELRRSLRDSEAVRLDGELLVPASLQSELRRYDAARKAITEAIERL
jgi:hypothetical protein